MTARVIAFPGAKRARSWRLAQVVRALHSAFPNSNVERRRPIYGADVFVITRPRASASPTLSALRVPFALLAACRDEADVTTLITGAMPRLRAGEFVELRRQLEGLASPDPR